MKNAIIITALAALLSVQCTNKKDAFTITNGKIGTLTSQTTLKQLKTVFANDSIVPLSNSSPSDALARRSRGVFKRWQQTTGVISRHT